jgi:hypothetical protein
MRSRLTSPLSEVMSAVTSRCSLVVNFIVENIFPSSESDLKPGNREAPAAAAADPDQEYVVPGSASLMAIVNALARQHSKAMVSCDRCFTLGKFLDGKHLFLKACLHDEFS